MEFFSICGKVVAKNRAFGNNIIFLQQFFQFRGGGRNVPCVPPAGATGITIINFICEHRTEKGWRNIDKDRTKFD